MTDPFGDLFAWADDLVALVPGVVTLAVLALAGGLLWWLL